MSHASMPSFQESAMLYREALKVKQVRMSLTRNPNPVVRTSEGAWVIVERRDRTERCRFLVDEADYERLVKPYRWNVGGVNYDRVYHSAYVPSGSRRSTVLLARWLLNPPADKQVDHEDRDTLNNRRSNLRQATNKQNSENVTAKKGSRSRYRGVHKDPMCPNKPWRAAVTHNYKQYNSPRFADEKDAYQWAVAKRAELFTHTREDE